MSVNAVNSDGSLSKIAGGINTNDTDIIKSDLSYVEPYTTATAAHAQGDCFVMNTGQLVRATSAIDIGDTITLNTNVSAVSIIELLAEKANITSLGTAAYKAAGSANGVAELDANGHVPSSQLPSYVDDVIEGYYKTADGKFYEESTYETEIIPEASKIYIDLTTDTTYRWGGSTYVAIGSSLALGETSSTAYRGDRGKSAYDHATESGKVSAAVTTGLYKIGVTAQGHISEAVAVQPSDLNAGSVNGISFSLEE